MASEVFELAILLSLKDAASGGLDRFGARLRGLGKDGQAAVEELDKIRANLNRDMAIGGVGIAGLALIGKGVQVAGNFQSSMTDLRSTLSEVGRDGKVNFDSLGKDMLKAEAIAMKLGNALPGTTEDFIQMMQILKQGGLDTQTILDGAAESVANLAVANNAAPRDIAKDFAKFGQIYKLKPEEYKGAADLFSRVYTSKGVESGELIESTKYFQGRAGNALGMTGLKGADESVRLMSYLQKQGLEASQSGTSASTFFVQLAKNKKALAEIQKEYGITFDLFDKQGKFKGIENAVSELEKLKKLNPEQLLVALNKLGGEEGSMAGTAIVSGGVAGWKQHNAEVDKAISLQQKNAEKSKDFNNQLEALTGSLQNLVVTGFSPLLPMMTSGAESANQVVGALQGFAKENPGLTKTLGTLALYGSTALVVYSGFKTLTTGIQLFRLASSISSGGGLLQYLNQTSVAANTASTSITTATTKARGLRGALQSQTVKIGVQIGAIIGIEYLVGVIQWEVQQAFNAGMAKKNAVDAATKNYSTFQQAEKDGTKFTRKDFDMQADTAWYSVLKGGLKETFPSVTKNTPVGEVLSNNATQTYLYPITKMMGAENPFLKGFGGAWDKQSRAAGFKKTAPQLEDPKIMASFLRQMNTRLDVPSNEKKPVYDVLATAFPESFTAAMQEIGRVDFTPLTQGMAVLQQTTAAQQQNAEIYNQQGQVVQTFGQNLNNLQMPINQTQNNITDLANSAQRVPPPLNNIANSANNASNSLNSLSEKIAGWQPPTPQIQTINVGVPAGAPPANPSGFSIFPGRAIGGIVERDGLAMVHAGNVITPARVTKGLDAGRISQAFSRTGLRTSNDDRRVEQVADARRILSSSSSNSVTLNYSPKVTINGASPSAKEDFQAMLNEHSKEIDRIMGRQMKNGRERA